MSILLILLFIVSLTVFIEGVQIIRLTSDCLLSIPAVIIPSDLKQGDTINIYGLQKDGTSDTPHINKLYAGYVVYKVGNGCVTICCNRVESKSISKFIHEYPYIEITKAYGHLLNDDFLVNVSYPMTASLPIKIGDCIYLFGYKEDGSVYEGSGRKYIVQHVDDECMPMQISIRCAFSDAKRLSKMIRECEDVKVVRVEREYAQQRYKREKKLL